MLNLERCTMYKIMNFLFCNSFRETKNIDIARKIGISNGTIGLEIKNLIRKDLIILINNNKRGKYWKLNEKGKELARAFLKIKEILEVEREGEEEEEKEQEENVLQNQIY